MKTAKIKSIEYIGKSDVYNMEVETHHNFSVDGGLIVHNCLDAIRYPVYTIEGGVTVAITEVDYDEMDDWDDDW